MKSVYYTFTTWNDGERAAGFGGGRQAVMVRQPAPKARQAGGDNVIDLSAWRPAGEESWDEPEELDRECAPEGAGPESSARRVRRSHSARVYWELASILGVAGVLVALLVRVLAF